MSDATIADLDGKQKIIPEDAVKVFADGLKGDVLDSNSKAYDEARVIWNAMIDRKPALIVQCAGTADVIRSVKFVAEHSLRVAVRGGGHNIAGLGICDDGVLIDLSGLRAVRPSDWPTASPCSARGC